MTPGASPWPPIAPEPRRAGSDLQSQFAKPGPPKKSRPSLHLVLLLATVVTTIIAGAILQGVDPFAEPEQLYLGVPFSFTLLLILGAHEMGHYLMARRHGLNVSLPYFIPGPPLPPGPGTFGAVIRIRSPIQDRRALLDVGCAGPLIGVALSIPVILVGLHFSKVVTMPADHDTVVFGESLLFKFLTWLVFGDLAPEQVIMIHSVAYAGWLGLFITALNLMPIGQLDGGHVIYALFPKYHRYFSWLSLGLLAVFGLFFWLGWFVWVGLILFILGWRHPPPFYDWVPLDRRRQVLGIITIAVFILTFSPMPFSLE